MHKFVAQMGVDDRLCSVHLCLFAAIAYLGKDTRLGACFRITCRQLMRHSGIRSNATYHKRLNELVSYGYIHYLPSYDPFLGGQLKINT